MKPVQNINKKYTLRYNWLRHRFLDCVRCQCELPSNNYMHDACWQQTTEEDKELLYRLIHYIHTRYLESIELEFTMSEISRWRDEITEILEGEGR